MLSILPASAVARLDFERLTVRAEREVDEALRAFETDLLALVTLVETSEEASGAFIYVLVEHQSTRDPFMALRALTYVGQVWQAWHRDHPKARTLPLVVPIVVYNCERPWTASLTVHGPLPTLSELPELRAFVPNVTLLLDDLSRQSDDDLRQRVMASAMGPIGAVALEALKHVQDAEVDARAIDWVLRVSRATADNDPDLRAVVRLLHSLFDASSGISAETLKATASVGPERMEETVMTLARQWIAEGEAKGRVEGERALLRALIVHKFGVIPRSVKTALETADEPSLSVWASRIFSAPSAEEVVA